MQAGMAQKKYFSFAFSYPAKEKVGWYAYFPATSKKQIKLKTNA